MAQITSSDRKNVLVLSLEDCSVFGETYKTLFDAIRAKANLTNLYTESTTTAINSIDCMNFAAIIIFEPSIMSPEGRTDHKGLIDKLISYTLQGGTVIYGGLCSGFMHFDWLEPFLKLWDLEWKLSNYSREAYKRNPDVAMINGRKLPDAYNTKALGLRNVIEGDVVYRVEYHMYSDDEEDASGARVIVKKTEGPVVWKAYGDGHVAWIGDVNNDKPSVELYVAMSGL